MKSGRNSKFGFRMLATSLAAAAVLAACGSDSTSNNGPADPINDPAGLTQNLNTILGTLNTGAIAGLGALPNAASNALAGLSVGGGGGSNVLRQMIAARPSQMGVSGRRTFISNHARPLNPGKMTQGTRVAQGDAINDELYGSSYSYDVESGQYIDDGADAGPANGVRFTLYEVDANGAFVDPLTESGTLDITDESTASTTAVGIKINGLTEGETFADYTVTVSNFVVVDEESGFFTYTLTSAGTVSSDGTNQYNFTFNETQTTTGYSDGVTFGNADFTLADLFAREFAEDGTSTITLDVSLTAGDHSVRLAGPLSINNQSELTAGDLKVYTDGDLYAEATDLDEAGRPNFLKASDGQPISEEEFAFLNDLLDAANDVAAEIYDTVLFALYIIA